MKKKRRATGRKSGIRACSLFLSLTLLLAGCGGGNTPSPEPESGQTGQADGTESGTQAGGFASKEEYEAWFQSRSRFDLLTEKWANREELKDPETYWSVADYRDNLFAPQEGQRYAQGSFVYGKDYYCLEAYYIIDEKTGLATQTNYYLEHLDGNTYAADQVKCDGAETLSFSEESANTFVSSFDGAGGDLNVIWQCMDEDSNTTHLYAVPLGTDGHFYGTPTDLIGGVEKAGYLPEKQFVFRKVTYDKRGYYMFLNDRLDELVILNEQGELKETVSDRGDIMLLGKTPEGVCIFAATDWNDASSGTTYFYYGENGVQNLMKEDANTFVTDRYINAYGDVIEIRQGTTLVTWNLSSGKNEKNYIGSTNSFNGLRGLLQNDRGEILCVQYDGSGYSVTVYSPTGAAKVVTLDICCYYYWDFRVQQALTNFQQKHPGITFNTRELVWETREEEWSKILMDVTQGEGPDVLLVPRPQMKMLAEKGVLEDLTDVPDKEAAENIYPGVLDTGRLDGRLYGLTFQTTVQTVLVRDDIWPGDSWTIADAMQLLEEKEKSGEPYLGVACGWARDDGMTAQEMLRFMLKNLQDSPFLDLKQGSCHFDDPEFVRLLELCQKYGAPESDNNFQGASEDAAQYKATREGQVLSYMISDGWKDSFAGFSDVCSGLGEGFHVVGFPTEGKSGSLFTSDLTVCVNKKAHENMDVISELLNYFYSMDVQMEAPVKPVRKDYLRACVVDKVDWSEDSYVHIPNSNSWSPVAHKPDGTTYVEEYLALMDSCVAQDSDVLPIESIVYEEVQAFFAGGKSAQAVADIIQSRVAIYLAERN